MPLRIQARLGWMNPEICDYRLVRIAPNTDMMGRIHGS
jgi:hypothetical protein